MNASKNKHLLPTVARTSAGSQAALPQEFSMASGRRSQRHNTGTIHKAAQVLHVMTTFGARVIAYIGLLGWIDRIFAFRLVHRLDRILMLAYLSGIDCCCVFRVLFLATPPGTLGASGQHASGERLQVLDLLALTPGLQKLHTDSATYRLQHYHAASLPSSLQDWALKLTETNVRHMYEVVWGWDAEEKRSMVAHVRIHLTLISLLLLRCQALCRSRICQNFAVHLSHCTCTHLNRNASGVLEQCSLGTICLHICENQLRICLTHIIDTYSVMCRQKGSTS